MTRLKERNDTTRPVIHYSFFGPVRLSQPSYPFIALYVLSDYWPLHLSVPAFASSLVGAGREFAAAVFWSGDCPAVVLGLFPMLIFNVGAKTEEGKSAVCSDIPLRMFTFDLQFVERRLEGIVS